jgi:long-chain acyl-CoA synthetase
MKVMANLFFLDLFNEYGDKSALLWQNQTFTYKHLSERIRHHQSNLVNHKVKKGTVVSLVADFTPNSIAMLFALIEKNCIIVPLLHTIKVEQKELHYKTAMVQIEFQLFEDDELVYKMIGNTDDNEFYQVIRKENNPGLVLFTSGSSGKPKAVVHNFSKLLKKYQLKRKKQNMINFLLWDHWGGLNTVFHILSNGGIVLTISTRSVSEVFRLVEEHNVEVLPASPSFLNLSLISKEYEKRDVSSLKLITYGTETMPETTLKRLNLVLPHVKFQQTYGLIELGVLRTKSKSSDSLWVKIGGEGYQTRIADGLLEIKAESAMLGYLNADSPFTEDGWFKTGDAVEVDGEFVKFLGRRSELISVGGEKVYPQEVENCIQELEEVAEVVVFKMKNPLLGAIVCAKVRLNADLQSSVVKKKILSHCREKLEKYKVPLKIDFTDQEQHSERFKKNRSQNSFI